MYVIEGAQCMPYCRNDGIFLLGLHQSLARTVLGQYNNFKLLSFWRRWRLERGTEAVAINDNKLDRFIPPAL